ncbi:MAG: HAMP domain-containing sensor histidine kinase [Anaerovoracaceae bacterium]|nr:HAMP domain-containing sensor histidine kinase [Anaerovoracaceae bacterium]
MKLRIDYKSIKFKTWLYFILFAGFLMLLLWVLQVLFLNNFYDVMKDEQTKRVAKTIADDYQKKSNIKFLKSVDAISNSNDMFIYVVSYDGKTMYFKPSGDSTSAQYYADQIETINKALLKKNSDSAYLRIKSPDESKDVLAYGAVLTASGKSPMMVYIFSPLWPLSSTINILTNQLVYVTFISLLAACLLSFYLSIRITRPIRTITRSAERLGNGEYGILFRGGHYTEINNLADTLTRASIELEKSDMLQKDLIANVSHDLRTPLTMIKSYAEMINDLSGDNPEKRAQHLKVIIDETDRLNALVGDLLSISRMQSGKMVLERSNFNLTSAIESIVNTYKIMEMEKGYTLNFNCRVNFIVNGDEEKIKQVVANLLTNAIKFAGEDKMVNITLKRRGKVVVCRVEDHGKGIAPEELDHVWERYYRASSNMVRPAEGSGLGLSIVKEILTMHKSDFGVESNVGKGSTFWFELPYIKAERHA